MGQRMKKIIVGIDMDNTIVDFHSHPTMDVPKDSYNHPNIFRETYFKLLKPFDGVVDKVKELMSMANVEVYVVTHPLRGIPHCYSEKVQWIQRYLPEINSQDRLIMICDKSLFLGDYLLDDDIKWKTFQGELISIDPNEDVAEQFKLFISYLKEDRNEKNITPN